MTPELKSGLPTNPLSGTTVTPREPSAAFATDVATRARQRRRLWHLPTQAHELLLAMSFTPDWLRREAARTLGQIHKGHCLLRGQDVDVLYSVVHDLVNRNPLSEAMHKHLDARHELALRALAGLRDADALRAAWAQALTNEVLPAAMPATLWALLTHPLGEALQVSVLYDARAWVFAHARRSAGQVLAQQQTEARSLQARQRADDLQARLLAQQQQSAEALRRAQCEIARLQGELARRPATDSVIRVPPVMKRVVQLSVAPTAATVRRKAPNQEASAGAPSRQVAATAPPLPGRVPVPEPALAPSATVAVAGRRVLCVGGIQHAVARYRGRIEKLGGRFEHHDGGLEDGVQALDARLGRAEVVICQAACINHEAYHRVKRHCERTGTPCIYLDRPSLSRLDRALASEQEAPHAPG